jgi:hypothetical protein
MGKTDCEKSSNFLQHGQSDIVRGDPAVVEQFLA